MMSEEEPATAGAAAADAATEIYAEHRELLFAIVYNLLGSVADTEDVLQETWLAWVPRYRAIDAEPIDSPRGYLIRIAVNRALARRAAIDRRRETYVGPWLPEPLADAPESGAAGDTAEAAVRTESLSMAVLVLLETLSPLERAVFVLHNVFGYTHPEIAGIVDRSPSAVRQLAHRARAHVHAGRPRYHADPRVQRQATERFVTAAAGGNLDTLLRVLAPDVTLVSDAGGKVRRANLRPVHGRDKVARFLLGVASSRTGAPLDVRYRRVNGDPSVLLLADDAPFAVLVLDLTPDGDQVSHVYAVANPDKLTGIGSVPGTGSAPSHPPATEGHS